MPHKNEKQKKKYSSVVCWYYRYNNFILSLYKYDQIKPYPAPPTRLCTKLIIWFNYNGIDIHGNTIRNFLLDKIIFICEYFIFLQEEYTISFCYAFNIFSLSIFIPRALFEIYRGLSDENTASTNRFFDLRIVEKHPSVYKLAGTDVAILNHLHIIRT